MSKPRTNGPRGLTAALALVLTAGGAMLVLHVLRYPPSGFGAPGWSWLTPPRPDKLVAMLVTMSWLVGINLAAWMLGILVEKMLPVPRYLRGGGILPVYRLGFGFVVLSLLMLLLAAAGWLVLPVIVPVIGIPALGACVRWLARARDLKTRLAASLLRGRGLLLAAALGILLVNTFLGTFNTDYGWDAVTYHLALPERYLFENGIVVTPFSQFSAYPFMMEMLFLLALALDGATLATLLHFEFGVLILVAVYLLGRRFSTRAAVAGAAILLADTLFHTEMAWAYNDLTLAFYALLAATAMADWMEEGDRGSIVYAGLFAGVCVLIKFNGGIVVLALLLLPWLPRGLRSMRANLGACVVVAGLTFLVSLPWLARNFVFTGNPVAPMLQRVFHARGSEFFDPIAIKQSGAFLRTVGMGRGPLALAALPWNLTMETVPGSYSKSFGFQVTPMYALGALAALLAVTVRRNPRVSVLLKVAGLYTLVWFFTSQEARYLIPVFPLLALAAGAGFDRLASVRAPWGRIVLLLPLAAVVYCQSAMLENLPANYSFALGNLSKDDFEEVYPPEASARALRKIMNPGDRVLLFYEGRGYHFRGLDYIPYHINEGSPLLQLIHRNRTMDGLCRRLHELGVTHVLINTSNIEAYRPPVVPEYGRDDLVDDLKFMREFLAAHATSRYSKDGFWIGELRCDFDP